MTYAIYLRKSRKDDEVISGDTLSRADSRMATRLFCAQLTRFHMKTAKYGGILLRGWEPPAYMVCTLPP